MKSVDEILSQGEEKEDEECPGWFYTLSDEDYEQLYATLVIAGAEVDSDGDLSIHDGSCGAKDMLIYINGPGAGDPHTINQTLCRKFLHLPPLETKE